MVRALIVDDEPATSDIIEHFIKAEALPLSVVGRAKDGEEAFAMIKELRPHIVFLDIRMPRMDGFQVIKKTQEEHLDNVNFIIITGYDLFEYAQTALRLGAKDILLKPIDLFQLEKTIKNNLGYQYTCNSLANSVLAHLHGHYMEPITLNQVAADLFVSAQYLAKTFKKHTGVTFNTYLNDIRIQKAKFMLVNTSISINEISDAVGYLNINNFYTHFKKATGMTPKQYIDYHRGNKTES